MVMHIFWTDLKAAEGLQPRREGRSKAPGSGFAWSLLEYAVQKTHGIALPAVGINEHGKPIFPSLPHLCFSLSHTNTAVLVAVSDQPLGADVESRRKVRPSLEQSLFSIPHGDLDLFELWTLRESWYKLTGRGDLRSIPFSRADGIITGPESGLYAKLYDSIPGCAAAVCSFHEMPPADILRVDPLEIARNEV